MASNPPESGEQLSTVRLVLMLGAGLVLGGAGVAYVWSTLNAVAEGRGSLERVVLAVPVAIFVALLVLWFYRRLSRLAAQQEGGPSDDHAEG